MGHGDLPKLTVGLSPMSIELRWRGSLVLLGELLEDGPVVRVHNNVLRYGLGTPLLPPANPRFTRSDACLSGVISHFAPYPKRKDARTPDQPA